MEEFQTPGHTFSPPEKKSCLTIVFFYAAAKSLESRSRSTEISYLGPKHNNNTAVLRIWIWDP